MTSQQYRQIFLNESRRCGNDDELQSHLQSRLDNDNLSYPATFEHTPLPHEACIRLLSLSPGRLDHPIQCSLQSYDAVSTPNYVALSYTWGNTKHRLPILCNNKAMFVTINLYSALLRLRSSEQALTLWVDAICIDQSIADRALAERAAQVAMMGDIFRDAQEVRVDLGGARKQYTDRLISFIDFFEDVTTNPNSHLRRSCYDKQFWIVWHEFLRRPWFSRVWIVQEYILARRTYMMIGRVRLERTVVRDTFIRTLIYVAPEISSGQVQSGKTQAEIAEISELMKGTLTVSACFRNIERFKQSFEINNLKQDLPTILELAATMSATDSRDRIYAFVGLLTDWPKWGIPIDYSLKSESVTLAIARGLIRNGYEIWCLERARCSKLSGPTWTPLMIQGTPSRVAITNFNVSRVTGLTSQLYNACGLTQLNIRLTALDDKLLSVRGILVDSIQQFGPLASVSLRKIWMNPTDTQIGITDALTWYRTAKQWAFDCFATSQMSTIRVTELFERTLIFDLINDHSVTPPSKRRSTTQTRRPHFRYLDMVANDPDGPGPLEANEGSLLNADISSPLRTSIDRKLAYTEGGRMANVPKHTTHDNEIWIFLGVRVPVVLRRLGKTYAFVGLCYVDGLMDGEVFSWPEGRRREQTILLE